MRDMIDRWTPGISKGLSNVHFPADPYFYRDLEQTCTLSAKEIYVTHNELAVIGATPTDGPITSEDLIRCQSQKIRKTEISTKSPLERRLKNIRNHR